MTRQPERHCIYCDQGEMLTWGFDRASIPETAQYREGIVWRCSTCGAVARESTVWEKGFEVICEDATIRCVMMPNGDKRIDLISEESASCYLTNDNLKAVYDMLGRVIEHTKEVE